VYSGASSSGGLGYVDTMHQSLKSVPGATVLTHYRALGDLPTKTRQIDITRYGHAMATPVPQIHGQIGLGPPWNMRKQLSKTEQYPSRPVLEWERLTFAHSDWAGYSVFEEAFTAGHAAGQAAGKPST
jgi:hypothetical protein